MTRYDARTVSLSPRDANTLRLALATAAGARRDAGKPPNDLLTQAQRIAERLLEQTEAGL